MFGSETGGREKQEAGDEGPLNESSLQIEDGPCSVEPSAAVEPDVKNWERPGYKKVDCEEDLNGDPVASFGTSKDNFEGQLDKAVRNDRARSARLSELAEGQDGGGLVVSTESGILPTSARV